MLGLHDRRKAKEQNRLSYEHDMLSFLLYTRRQIRVNKILVHGNFTDAANDIALLRLGTNGFCCNPLLKNLFNIQLTEEIVDLSVFSPLCLPGLGENFVGQNGHVYGEQLHENNVLLELLTCSLSQDGESPVTPPRTSCKRLKLQLCQTTIVLRE